MTGTLSAAPLIPPAVLQELNTPIMPPADVNADFRRRGFVVLRQAFSRELISFYRELIYTRVHELSKETRPLNERSDYNRAFLQVSNIWKHCPVVKEIVLSRRMASIVSAALGASRVRLWDEHALYKEPGGGPTFLHTDWNYIPIVEDNVCAVWLPLQPTPRAMGALQFVEGSHRFGELHGAEVSQESDAMIRRFAQEKGLANFATDFEEGDVSIHNVRTAHWTESNTTGRARSALSLFYFAEGSRFTREPFGKFQEQYWDNVLGGAKNAGQVIGGDCHPLAG
ncbi:MAG TPA: phytanoyl-CoA dioxygenase family protein [Planctomycetota bacterium]|nr:phytanoyl-CoA dioxygenase family protein [Planctomycetota bacterium]